ncbi:MAG: hydroxyacid dehydrogenase [Pirellulales bacterium]
MTDVLVTENITGTAMDRLRQERDVAIEPDLWRSPEKLKERIRDVAALMVRNQTQVTSELIASAPRLKVIARAGAGLDNIDTRAANDAGVVVCYSPHENSVSVAELTIGLILALARRIPAADADTRAGGWKRQVFTGIELCGKTLGVVGLGTIGTLVAQRARALDMAVLAHDDYVDSTSAQVRTLGAKLVSLDQLLSEADCVVCHVPLTEETRGMFDAARFQRMKPTAMFVNTSRGEVVDEAALVEALQQKRIAGAALDVRSVEPPGRGPLNELDNVILTPHIAAFTHEAQDRVVATVCRDVAAVLAGGEATNVFNLSAPQ